MTHAESSLAEQIQAFLEGELRPAIREDGGDLVFEGLAGDTVRIALGAACATCPARDRTARHFVERRLRRRFGDRFQVSARFVKPYFAG